MYSQNDIIPFWRGHDTKRSIIVIKKIETILNSIMTYKHQNLGGNICLFDL